jgi:lipoprotein-releasing system permease protein
MAASFELFIARRYLKARRKEAVISVITAISVLGVAAGVMALIVALAVTSGLRDTLQRNLLGAMADINIQEKEPQNGIENWERSFAGFFRCPMSPPPGRRSTAKSSSPVRSGPKAAF